MVPPPKNHRIHLAFNKATLSCAKTGVRCSAAIPRIRRLFLPVSDSSHQLGSAAVVANDKGRYRQSCTT
jgi:hypothetical protein